MKIIQLIQKSQLRGAEIFAAHLAQELEKKGHTILLVSLFEGTSSLPFEGRHISLEANQANRFWDWKAWKKLAQIIEDFQPDILQANAGDTLKYAGMSRFFFRWKGKLIFRNANLISEFLDSSLKISFNKFLLRQVDGVASVSRLCLGDFIKTYAWEKPIFHLPIGPETLSQKSPLPDDIATWLQGRPFLIHIGSFVPEKNHKGLIRIFLKVRKINPEIKLILCGAGPLLEEFQKMSLEGVLFSGERNDATVILGYAKALLLPSLIEGLPGVILEAMMLQVPVVAYDVGGVSELINTGKTGYLIPKNVEREFENAVLKILDSSFQKLNTEIIQNARMLVQENYSLSQVVSRFEKSYRDFLAYSK